VEVVQRFREARLKCTPEKFQLFQKEVQYLGHIVSPEGITTDPEKLRAVREWPTPKTKYEIRIFLCQWPYYRWFIFGSANFEKTPTKLMRRCKPSSGLQKWRPPSKHWRRPSVLTLFLLTCSQERFVVDTDKSNVRIGGVLS
jgi:hypothetical protein